MNYKMVLYTILTLLAIFGLSGINTNGLFKTNKRYEAITLILLLAIALGYLATNFIWDFIGVSNLA